MNVLDIVILLLFLPGIIRGLSKGFIEQAVSLAGIVAAAWTAYHYSALVSEKLKEYFEVSDTVLNIAAFVLVLIAVMIIVLILAKLLTSVTKMANLGWVNRLLGFVLSIIISAILISILIIIFDTVNTKFQLVTSPVITESILYDALKDFGYAIFPYLKGLLGHAQEAAASVTA